MNLRAYSGSSMKFKEITTASENDPYSLLLVNTVMEQFSLKLLCNIIAIPLFKGSIRQYHENRHLLAFLAARYHLLKPCQSKALNQIAT